MANKTQFSAAHKKILKISARVLPLRILLSNVTESVPSYILSLAKLLCILVPPEDLIQMLLWGHIQQPSPIACELPCSTSRQYALLFTIPSWRNFPRCLFQLLCLLPHSHYLWINESLSWGSSEHALWGAWQNMLRELAFKLISTVH